MNPKLMERARSTRRRTAAVAAGAMVLAVPTALFVGLRHDAPPSDPAVEAVRGPGLPRTLPLVPTLRPEPRPTPSPTAPPEPTDRLAMFSGLGAWVDMFDFEDLDPVTSVWDMRARGVRTLYLQTGRYTAPTRIALGVGPWLKAAHDAGLEVVGWYLPGYRKMPKEIDRTIRIATYEYEGHRFDGLGIDIEDKNKVRHNPTWNARVAEHARAVRAGLGPDYPIATIMPPPLQMDVAPTRWAGFPWKELAEPSDVLMLMSYWSFRDCPNNPDHCALPFTQKNIEITRALIGVDRPIHTIGGVGDSVTAAEIEAFAVGAERARAFGASIYDYRTTEPRFWESLERLADL